MRHVDVLGVHVSAVNIDSATEEIGSWIDSGRREYVCVTGVHGVMESQRSSELLKIHNAAGMVTPDGMPLVWSARVAGATEVDRVYGPDLMLRVSETSVKRGWSHFFYGAGPGVASQLGAELGEKFPGLRVAGTYTPPFRELSGGELDEVADMINGSGADIVWVGLSTPKQERWMSAMRNRLDVPVLIGVGAAFDIHAGRVRQAPLWMQRSGFEWLFRLLIEPKRLWRRYATIIPRFIVQIAMRRPRLKPESGVPAG